ncbi:MAG: PIG-L family deacetylase, partial [Clostridia bacterium]|nr:PIG-L family deacetylase [Clostridia bacterium]
MLLLALGNPAPVIAEDDSSAEAQAETTASEAENLTKRCTITSDLRSSYLVSRLTDEDTQTNQGIKAGQKLNISWTDGIPVRTVWIAFYKTPGPYRICQYDADGALLKEEAETNVFVNRAVFVEEATRTVTLIPETTVQISSLYAYGEGAVPNYHPWEPTPEKLDYLIVAMHPDDDVLFMGALVPMYSVEQGRVGTIFYTASDWRVRKDEAQNGAWMMGLRVYPIFGTFQDIPPRLREQGAGRFRKADVAKYLVGVLRRYRPEVVFSHDLNGEYGHWQHKELAAAIRMAVPLAADPTYDPATVEQYGVWEVKKLYLHLYEENPIHLPVTEPLASMDGQTPVQIAEQAFQCHQSQLPSRHAVRNEGIYSMSDFGLAYTTVGLDTAGLNDPFEHIDKASLHTKATPTPA